MKKQNDQPIDNKSIDPVSLDAAKAQAAIEADQKRRSALAAEECGAILKRLNCEIQYIEVKVNGQITQQAIAYVAK